MVDRLLMAVASPFVERRLSDAQASVVAAHGLSTWSFWDLEHGIHSCGAWA